MNSPETKIQHLFAAPLYQFMWNDCPLMNLELRRLILEKRDELPSERMSNSGGWQSPKTLHTWKAPCFQTLVTMVETAVLTILGESIGQDALSSIEQWHIAAWANVNECGDYNMIHNHSGGVFSGVYYVDVGTPDAQRPNSGVLSFRSPTLAQLAIDNLRAPEPLRKLFKSNFAIAPKNGLMLVFPSWLEHQVHPYHGHGPRISVSWDVIFPPGEPREGRR